MMRYWFYAKIRVLNDVQTDEHISGTEFCHGLTYFFSETGLTHHLRYKDNYSRVVGIDSEIEKRSRAVRL